LELPNGGGMLAPFLCANGRKRRERKTKNVPRFVVVIGSPLPLRRKEKKCPGYPNFWFDLVLFPQSCAEVSDANAK
jgi:hypothetical protein